MSREFLNRHDAELLQLGKSNSYEIDYIARFRVSMILTILC